MSNSPKIQGFILYRFYYGDSIVYVGRTKQPLQDRIRGHLFSKPMHRKIEIEQVSKIEYAQFQTEADMNLYEIYYILKLHPPLNVDDKAKDTLTIELPEAEWTEFIPPLWDKWKKQLAEKVSKTDRLVARFREIPEEMTRLRAQRRKGELKDEEFEDKYIALREELDRVREELWV